MNSPQTDQIWQFWIDVGGTFTDCIAVTPDGDLKQFKTLSSGVTKGSVRSASENSFEGSPNPDDPAGFWSGARCRLLDSTGREIAESIVTAVDGRRFSLKQLSSAESRRSHHGSDAPPVSYELDCGLPAPVLGIRWLMGLAGNEACPPVRVRFGTTRGTNALLTRTGARTALIATKGFADVPLIGNQDRPDLFDLNIRKPESLFESVFEVDERISSEGDILHAIDLDEAKAALVACGLSTDSFDSVAICLLNSYANDVHERLLETVVRELGFEEVSRSSEVSPLIRFVPRCDTTVLDGYLNPVLRTYLQEIESHLPGSDIQVMTSAGGLVGSSEFRGRDCILSGPAGGIVGFSTVAHVEGFDRAIGFDMGGTSTDVARFDGQFEFERETEKAGVRIMTPVLAIETVAAGGGSICGFDGTRLFVGPQSAGANPGPACYGAGGPLTVTDLNVLLGRVLPQHFPFHLDVTAVRQRLSALQNEMRLAGIAESDQSLESLAEGLLQIANDNMVQAIRRVSVAKGYDPSEFALVSFGGAGGQHACEIARRLNIGRVIVHPLAGILSAYGMGHADVRAIRQTSFLKPLNAEGLNEIRVIGQKLEHEAQAEVRRQLVDDNMSLEATLSLELRYAGTDSALLVAEHDERTFRESFELEHRRLFGFVRADSDVEVATVRVECVGRLPQPTLNKRAQSRQAKQTATTKVFHNGEWTSAAVIHRVDLTTGDGIAGPAIVCEPTSTVFIEPSCSATVAESEALIISVEVDSRQELTAGESVLLEVFNNQFVSIAEQMGETLRRTSTSTNVRERLDFSCALFDADGQLVVNAPHVPVHLGAMGETVRAIMQDHKDMSPGDVFVTNDPFRGGSHLPDVTVITPVFCDGEASPSFFVANRAHHAEIGGIVPGSMPPFSKNLAEEGVLIRSQRLVTAGVSNEDEIRQALLSGDFPTRSIDDNLADLAAQAAANECGVRLLQDLAKQHSSQTVLSYMQQIQLLAAKKMRLCLAALEDRDYSFTDKLDDGHQICVRISVRGDEAIVDFTGTSDVHPGNLNANRAITTAAVLYCFRCLLDEDVPLNAGVLEPVTLILPTCFLNPSAGESPETSPAIVGGNVETSQRIVDVILGALGLAAASQGTMNNLTFGDETFGYYETICGGAGATAKADGADAVHTHMTNTRLTDPEVLEQRYPVRLHQFSIRKGSGGNGQHRGGDGIVREIEFLKPLKVSMLSQRREQQPYGSHGGVAGAAGRNSLVAEDVSDDLGGCFSIDVASSQRLVIETPGGGGFGDAG